MIARGTCAWAMAQDSVNAVLDDDSHKVPDLLPAGQPFAVDRYFEIVAARAARTDALIDAMLVALSQGDAA